LCYYCTEKKVNPTAKGRAVKLGNSTSRSSSIFILAKVDSGRTGLYLREPPRISASFVMFFFQLNQWSKIAFIEGPTLALT
jgi:hypothetical protein